MHRLTKQEYKVWTSGAYHCDLMTLKMYKRIKGKCERDFETAKALLQIAQNWTDAVELVKLGASASRTPREVVRYFERIKEENNERACHWGYVTEHTVYSQWRDWRRMLEQEKSLNKNTNPFPRDLKAEHDAVLKRLQDAQAKRDLETKRKMIEAQEAEAQEKPEPEQITMEAAVSEEALEAQREKIAEEERAKIREEYERKLAAAANPDAQRAAMHMESMINSYNALKKTLERLPDELREKIVDRACEAISKMEEGLRDE